MNTTAGRYTVHWCIDLLKGKIWPKFGCSESVTCRLEQRLDFTKSLVTCGIPKIASVWPSSFGYPDLDWWIFMWSWHTLVKWLVVEPEFSGVVGNLWQGSSQNDFLSGDTVPNISKMTWHHRWRMVNGQGESHNLPSIAWPYTFGPLRPLMATALARFPFWSCWATVLLEVHRWEQVLM